MTLLDHIGLRRRTLALIGAAAIALAVVAGPSPAMAVRSLPDTPETSDGAGFLGGELGSGPDLAASRQAKRVDVSGDGSGGFIYRHGRYIPLDTVDDRITVHLAINNRGQTAGSYVRSLDPADFGGFVRNRTGRDTAVDAELGSSTLILDVNDEGTTVGAYGDAVTVVGGSFLRKPNGEVTTVEVPGASATGVNGINNRGAFVGNYLDADGVDHAFVMQRGKVTTIVPPGAPADPTEANVIALDVNDRGQVVGCYADGNGTYHGFRYDNGRFTLIDPPGGVDVADVATTCAFGINNRGQVVGQYVDAAGVLHGYLWQSRQGFETIDAPPGAPVVGPTGIKGTTAVDITDRGHIVLTIGGGFFKGRAVPIGD